jgi:NTP pyrophosphatase (non-canonical NTP hydrolase)
MRTTRLKASMDIQLLQQTLREFAAARNWQPFHAPKNLSTALMVESAELAEIFQWMTPDESTAAHLYPDKKEHIADEVADVLLYLLQVADRCAIDIPQAVANKLVKNAIKHPVPVSMSEPIPKTVMAIKPVDVAEVPASSVKEVKSEDKDNENIAQTAPQTHVLVDWENVQPADRNIQQLVPDVTAVWLFHGPQQKNVAAHQAFFDQRLTLVPIARAGKNALDFHLSFYMGYIASRNPHAHFVVISNDQGYLPMLEHARMLGFSAQQVGFKKPPTPEKQHPAPPADTTLGELKKTPTRAVQTVKKPSVKVPKQAPAVQKSLAVKSVAAIKKTPAVKKPAAAKKAPAPKATPAAKKAAKALAKPVVPVAVKTPATQKKTISSMDLSHAVKHVQSSLKKMANKPTRLTRLVAAIKSLLNESASDTKMVNEVLAFLEHIRFVTITDKGVVSFPV